MTEDEMVGWHHRLNGTAPAQGNQSLSRELMSLLRKSNLSSISAHKRISRRGSQGASRAVPGTSGLCAGGERERVMALARRYSGGERCPLLPLEMRPDYEGESGMQPQIPVAYGDVSRGSQGLRSPLQSRRGSLGAP